MDYLPPSEQLGAMLLSKEYQDMFQQTYEKEEDDIYYSDIFDGQQFKQHEHLFPSKFDTAYALYVDGFSPFRRGLNGAVSMKIVHIIILNLPPSESVFGCRICQIESSSQLSPNGLGNGQYSPGGIGLDAERMLEEFLGKLRDYRIYDGTPFSELPTFKNAFFMGCDKMHLLQNISRQLVDMFKGIHNNANTEYISSSGERKAIGNAIRQSSLLFPLGLEGSIAGNNKNTVHSILNCQNNLNPNIKT
ncbi:hypothetical protein BDC45DRAFT_575879 [Circinella umbellata]|nr:hypothetical protein BDC45DRAFT_575879 [Circinella umbellata]